MTRPVCVDIDLAAIRHNYLVCKQKAPNSRTLAVIKADAYGHGGLAVAQALADIADGFALLNIEDALRLRTAGIAQPIMLLEGPFDAAEVTAMSEHRLIGAIHSDHQLDWLRHAPLPRPLEVWLKLNSGMNRLGFKPERLPELLTVLASRPSIVPTTVMTHFATADDARGIATQWPHFIAATLSCGLALSAANSAALFAFPECHADVVRPGLVLYGASPFDGQTGAELGLKPAMTLSADIIAVQELHAGDSVGYGALFSAKRPMRIGVVACGYADGYPRIVPTGTPVSVDGLPSRTIGRVSMDMLTVDLSGLPQAGVGSRVELWGPNVPIERVAAAAGTLAYELMCAITARVPRRLLS